MRRYARVGRWLYAVALVAAITYAIASQRQALAEAVQRLSAGALLGAFACLVVGLLLSQQSWRAVLAGFGSPLGVSSSARIFFVGQLGKYLPGSVWPILTQMQLGKAVGVPRTRMGAATLVWLAFSVITGLAASMLVVPELVGGAGGSYAAVAVVLLVASAVGLHPRVLNAVLDKALKLARRPPLEEHLDGRGIARASLFLAGSWVLFGVQLWLLVGELTTGDDLSLPTAIGAMALANTLGFLFILAPAGAGVREVVLVLALSSVLSQGEATGVAVVSRVLMTVADLLLGVSVLVRRPALPLVPDAESGG